MRFSLFRSGILFLRTHFSLIPNAIRLKLNLKKQRRLLAERRVCLPGLKGDFIQKTDGV